MRIVNRAGIATLFFTVLHSLSLAGTGWSHYGGDEGGSRFSSLTQITPENVDELEVAWQIKTGEVASKKKLAATGSFQVTPILTPVEAGQTLVLCTPWNKVIGLDPTTGETRWEYDPKLKTLPLYNCRGVAYWEDTEAANDAACKYRIFSGTGDLRLLAIDAKTGLGCEGFGDKGQTSVVELVKQESPKYKKGWVKFFSAPVVVRDTLILGSSTFGKNKAVKNPSGAIRGFDPRTGEHRWSFDPIPRSEEDPMFKTWDVEATKNLGGASAWAPLSIDEQRGLVFVPTSSPSPDFYGGYRPGDNRYANSTVALDAETGKVRWHFQNIHHDVWDWDTPAQPIAVDITKAGKVIPAVIQLTKQGLVFTFNRDTGEPIFEVEERPVPTATSIPGEILSPTQPFPVAPPPLAPNGISPSDAWGLTFWDKGKCRELIEAHDWGPLYTPPSEKGYVSVTSINNWAGGAYDARSNTLITNASNLFWITTLTPEARYDKKTIENFGPPAKVIEDWGYAVTRVPIRSPWGLPCTAPPWGKLVAVDMAKGEIKWETPLGSLEKISPYPMPFELEWGTPGAAGGPIITASGLIFIGASTDEKFRAFDLNTGKKLWQATLPTSALATPMTYDINGRQYVVIASGGHVWQYPQNISDVVTAFALPDR